MKKFVYSLDPLYKVKTTMKEKLQTEYMAAESAFGEAYRKRQQIQETLNEETQKFETKVKDSGITAGDMLTYGLFFEDLQDREIAAAKDLERAKKNASRKRAELTGVFREVKMIEKLREKQYEEYRLEEEKKEKSVIEDLLAYNVAGKRAE